MTEPFSVWHYDGREAVRRNPEIERVGESFLLVDAHGRDGPYAFADLVYCDNQGTTLVYGIDDDGEDRHGWRLGLAGDIPSEIASRLPAKSDFGGWIDRFGLWPMALAFGVVSAAVLFVGIRAPDLVAPYVPESWERQMGDAMIGDMGGRFCSTPDGRAALDKMAAALDERPDSLQVEVANLDMVNAAALPGGKIILFNGLINEAGSPDEVAGVLAHELGHVRERHVMQSFLRQMGLSILLGGIDGSVGSTVNSLLSMSYGREAERSADRYSIRKMQAADVSPAGTAEMFERWAEKEEDITTDRRASFLGYLSSHPMSAERRDAFRSAVVTDGNYRPILTDKEWVALQDMCLDDPDVEGEGDLF